MSQTKNTSKFFLKKHSKLLTYKEKSGRILERMLGNIRSHRLKIKYYKALIKNNGGVLDGCKRTKRRHYFRMYRM